MMQYIPVSGLSEDPYSRILGYPRIMPRQMKDRLDELDELGVTSVSFSGPTELDGLRILGKGHAGVVVLAMSEGRRVALKIRRSDSARNEMKHESELLRLANTVGVGPRIHAASRNFVVMEYVDGARIGDWVRDLKGVGRAGALKTIVAAVLEDAYRLDQIGVDHGELSRISKHVIVDGSACTMIDFESASTERRSSNVTSAAQAIFIGSGMSRKVRRIYQVPVREQIIASLRRYKTERSRSSFDDLLGTLKL